MQVQNNDCFLAKVVKTRMFMNSMKYVSIVSLLFLVGSSSAHWAHKVLAEMAAIHKFHRPQYVPACIKATDFTCTQEAEKAKAAIITAEKALERERSDHLRAVVVAQKQIHKYCSEEVLAAWMKASHDFPLHETDNNVMSTFGYKQCLQAVEDMALNQERCSLAQKDIKAHEVLREKIDDFEIE